MYASLPSFRFIPSSPSSPFKNRRSCYPVPSTARTTLAEPSTGRRGDVILSRVTYEPLLHVVLLEPEIPQNTGNIGRTCVAVGAKLWMVHPLGFRLDDRHLRRAGLDYWQHLVWETADNWQALQEKLRPGQWWYFSKKASRLYTDAAFAPGDALVFGSETQGLPESLLQAAGQQALRLPIRDEVRSLNLGSCVAAATYEAVRQMNLHNELDLQSG